MEMKSICPCPNMECPNHGVCDKCTSRHVRLGYLNYCAFQTLVPALTKVIGDFKEDQVSHELLKLVEIQSQSYEKLMEKHGLNDENQKRLLKLVAEFSDH